MSLNHASTLKCWFGFALSVCGVGMLWLVHLAVCWNKQTFCWSCVMQTQMKDFACMFICIFLVLWPKIALWTCLPNHWTVAFCLIRCVTVNSDCCFYVKCILCHLLFCTFLPSTVDAVKSASFHIYAVHWNDLESLNNKHQKMSKHYVVFKLKNLDWQLVCLNTAAIV